MPFKNCGNGYMIRESKYILGAGMDLFILNKVLVPLGSLKDPLMPFCGPIYSRKDYLILARNGDNIKRYSICENWKSNPNPYPTP